MWIEEASEVGVFLFFFFPSFKSRNYSHGGLDIGNGVLSTNTVLPVVLQIHLLRRGEVVAAAQSASGQAVVVVRVIHMVEVIHVEDDVLLLLARLVPVEAVLEATGGEQQNQEYTQGAGAYGHVEQRHAETVRTVGLLLVEAGGAVADTVAP